MVQEEFSRLIYLYQQAAEGKGASVQEIFQKSLEFIERLKELLVTGDEEDRLAASRMMKELAKHMTAHMKIMSERAGISEEQMLANSENPANFTPEQWKKMQESKKKLAAAGKELVNILAEKTPSKKGATDTESVSTKASEKKAHKKKSIKKSHWMRS